MPHFSSCCGVVGADRIYPKKQAPYSRVVEEGNGNNGEDVKEYLGDDPREIR
jgi:hypothetical protein